MLVISTVRVNAHVLLWPQLIVLSNVGTASIKQIHVIKADRYHGASSLAKWLSNLSKPLLPPAQIKATVVTIRKCRMREVNRLEAQPASRGGDCRLVSWQEAFTALGSGCGKVFEHCLPVLQGSDGLAYQILESTSCSASPVKR